MERILLAPDVVDDAHRVLWEDGHLPKFCSAGRQETCRIPLEARVAHDVLDVTFSMSFTNGKGKGMWLSKCFKGFRKCA